MTAGTEPPESTDPAPADRAIVWLCIGLSVFQVVVTFVWPLTPLLHYALFVSAVSALVFLTGGAIKAPVGQRRSAGSWIWALASVAVGLYYLVRFEWITMRWPIVDSLGLIDLACGLIFLAIVVEATRRTVGWVLVGVMVVFLGYALLGQFAGSLFYHRPLSLTEVVDHLVFTGNGLFGAPVAVAATYVYTFVLFGTALEVSGGGDFLFRAASALTGRTQGGPAKVSVISSALYGSITGSPTANVMTTGLFTIPMMKRSGIRGEIAAATESVASTGGALLPPVMGSAAFLMAELTGIEYLDILVAGLVPALLFYFGLFAQVHFGAVRAGLTPDASGAEPIRKVLREGGHHLLPLALLVVLLVRGVSPLTAAGVALALTVVVSWREPDTAIGRRAALRILELSARRALLVTMACAAAGVVVGAIVTTGLGGKITSLIFVYAGGSLLAALLATMVVCVILGMGMPVPSAYVVTAVLAGPPLALMGLSTMSANLFILYFATLSAITPPVAVAAYAASSIADASPNVTALQAMRLGFIAFVIPFFFVYRPELLLEGSAQAIALAVFTSACGVLLVAGALEGFM
ncbi:MAG: TRAP transporter fused permease subunit, partial [Gemmatimonadetes bacterium]|nr:TRAP transporter fused permease subunit [Gemmatimonadota bacterium]